jgi:hypothetical protein
MVRCSALLIFALLMVTGGACAGFSSMERVALYQNLALYRLDAERYPSEERIRKEIPSIRAFPQLAPMRIIDLLGNIEYRKNTVFGTKTRRIFYPEELAEAAPRISEALLHLKDRYRLVIVSRYDPDHSVLSRMERVTAILWMDEAGLNIVFGEIRTEIPYDDYLSGEDEWMRIQPVSLNRAYYDLSIISSDSFTKKIISGRTHETWIVIPEGKIESIHYTPPVQKDEKEALKSLTERLSDLKKAKDSGLITEQDYEKKKEEILKDF